MKLFSNKILKSFILVCYLLLNINFSIGQDCNGHWVYNHPKTFQCISGQWIGFSNPGNQEPTLCPVNPVYTIDQGNTFVFDTPVSEFTLNFNAFTTGVGCARIEIKINGVFYPLTSLNFSNIPLSFGCTGVFSSLTVTIDGYISTSVSTYGQINGQGSITINNVNASSVTISSNDAAGSIVGNPYNCVSLLPLQLVHFKAAVSKDCMLNLLWQTANETNVRNIEIQSSSDGDVYKKISEVFPRGSNSNYSYESPFNGDNYYRLKINDFDGSATYSNVIRIVTGCEKYKYAVEPNPSDGFFRISGLRSVDEVLIFDMTGRRISRNFSRVGNDIFDIHSLASGIYNLKILHSGMIRSNIKVVKK